MSACIYLCVNVLFIYVYVYVIQIAVVIILTLALFLGLRGGVRACEGPLRPHQRDRHTPPRQVLRQRVRGWVRYMCID